MNAVIVAYFLVSIVATLWAMERDYIVKGIWPEDMEDVYIYVGFGFLWFVSVPWALWTELQYKEPIGQVSDAEIEHLMSATKDNKSSCVFCGDLRVLYFNSFDDELKHWAMIEDGRSVEVTHCPTCKKELPREPNRPL